MKTLQFALLAFLVTFAPVVRAALPTNGTLNFEIRPTNGNDNNGGCYVAGSSGTDFSQQNSTQKAFTDLLVGATTTQATSVLNPFASTDVGNCVKVVSGSGCTVGVYQIVSVSTITATMDRSLGTAASVCTANEGGAWQTIGTWNTLITATCGGACGWGAWVKAESTITTTTQFLFTAVTQPNSGSPGCFLQGYTSTRGDQGQVTIQQTAEISFDNAIIAIANNTGGFLVSNFILDCNSQTGGQALHVQGQQGSNVMFNISATNCKNSSGAIGFNNSGHYCIRCSVTGYTGTGSQFTIDGGNGGNFCIDCTATGGTGPGFVFAYSTCIRCIAANNTGTTSDGFQISPNSTASIINIDQSVAYNNGRDGIHVSPGTLLSITNTVLYGNAGFGINDVATNPLILGQVIADYNAFGSNTSGARENIPAGSHDVTLSADPFVNGASANFALNSTAGGGTALKGVGFPGALLVGGTGFMDIGALQHQATAGGGTSGAPIQ